MILVIYPNSLIFVMYSIVLPDFNKHSIWTMTLEIGQNIMNKTETKSNINQILNEI